MDALRSGRHVGGSVDRFYPFDQVKTPEGLAAEMRYGQVTVQIEPQAGRSIAFRGDDACKRAKSRHLQRQQAKARRSLLEASCLRVGFVNMEKK
jgi:hypothetical protein